MKLVKMAALILGGTLATATLSAPAADWNDPQEPFKIYGNTYYVGVRELGFKVEDIKFILNSHEHFDHAGGIAELQRLSGATALSSVLGEQVLRTGLTSKGDLQYANLPPSMPAIANTRAVRDGETITLGPLSVTAHYTPGHAAFIDTQACHEYAAKARATLEHTLASEATAK